MANKTRIQKFIDTHPEVTVTTKDTNKILWKVLSAILTVLTAGRMTNLITGFVTTLGNRIYFPPGWTVATAAPGDYITLQHEYVHYKQYVALGMGNVWLGFVLFAILYALLPVPTGYAWFRYKFEREAYLTSYLTAKQLKIPQDFTQYAKWLSGPEYFWAWRDCTAITQWFTQQTANKK